MAPCQWQLGELGDPTKSWVTPHAMPFGAGWPHEQRKAWLGSRWILEVAVQRKALLPPGKGNAGCPMASARHGWAGSRWVLKVLHKALPGKGNAGCPMASARHGWAHAGCPWPGGSRRARLGAPGAAQGIARARLSAQGAAQGGNYLSPPTVAH